MSGGVKIIIEVEGCKDCPMLRVDSYNQFRCHLFDAYLGTEIYDLIRSDECREKFKESKGTT